MISLAGLFLSGISVFSGLAIGTITVVGLSVLASVTVLPGLPSWLGGATDRGGIPLLGRRRIGGRPSRLWAGLARRVVRSPALWGGLAAAVLLALAAAALGIRTSNPGLHELPGSVPVIGTLAAIGHAFPGDPAPAEVVVTGSHLDRPQVAAAVTGLRAAAAASRGTLCEPITASLTARSRVLIITVPLAGDGTNPASDRALADLRGRVLPATLGKVSGIRYAVAGTTAASHDFAATLHRSTPIVFAFVLGLAFLLQAGPDPRAAAGSQHPRPGHHGHAAGSAAGTHRPAGMRRAARPAPSAFCHSRRLGDRNGRGHPCES
jgi:RND superfamily putative drug exporter